MNKKRHTRAYTLVEAVVAAAVTAIAVSATMSGFIYVLHGQYRNSTQSLLDMDVRDSVEKIRRDLRLSDMSKIMFYPPGLGPYTALCFPMVNYTGSGAVVTYDTNGTIRWDRTVVYHVWEGLPNELRVTSFSPRNNDLTDEQRIANLTRVVADGNGDNVTNEPNAQTRVIFQNLVIWQVYPQRAIYDGYSPTPMRDVNRVIGSMVLSNSIHTFGFTVLGKNTASSGYRIGLDRLLVSGSGLPREGESQPVSAYSGPAPYPQYRTDGSWSGNFQLTFPATGTGQYFRLAITNDCWEEENFDGTGIARDQSVVLWDEYRTNYIACLDPPTYDTWMVNRQTGDSTWNTGTSGDELRGAAVRVMMRGKSMTGGGTFLRSAPMSYVLLYSSPYGALRVRRMYVAECASEVSQTPDTLTDGIPVGSGGVDISSNSACWVGPMSSYFVINDEKSYLVTFLVSADAAHADARYWTETQPGVISSWIIPGSANPDESVAQAAVWSTNLTMTTDTRLFGMYEIYTLAYSNGTFISQIVDTQIEDPAYQMIGWKSYLEYQTTISMKVRTGDQEDLSDALAWSNVTARTTPGPITPGTGRYCQFRADMTSGSGGWNIPRLFDVRISWQEALRSTDLGGTFAKGPNYGIFELTVDDQPIIKGCTMDMTIYKDIRGLGGVHTNRLTSTVTAEIYPRNTGK